MGGQRPTGTNRKTWKCAIDRPKIYIIADSLGCGAYYDVGARSSASPQAVSVCRYVSRQSSFSFPSATGLQAVSSFHLQHLTLSARRLRMESNSADRSGPSTPAPTSHAVLSVGEQSEITSKPSSKQRQRTRRACYPCSKVRKFPCGRRRV